MSNIKKDKYKVYNSCHQNWYETGDVTRPHCDWHPVHVPGMPIWSVSWEGPRIFVLIPEYKDGFKHEIIVMSGDLIVMGGTCQLSHKHAVPKARRKGDSTPHRCISWTIWAFDDRKEACDKVTKRQAAKARY
jgi:alkylated DNA repair dioxygenase AlkB